MTSLFLDLIQDLREKRLWPVAVALLVATAAVPLVLLKSSEGPSDSAPAIASGSVAEGLPVVNVAKASAAPSSLNEFSEKNPFKPTSKLASGAPGGAPTTVG